MIEQNDYLCINGFVFVIFAFSCMYKSLIAEFLALFEVFMQFFKPKRLHFTHRMFRLFHSITSRPQFNTCTQVQNRNVKCICKHNTAFKKRHHLLERAPVIGKNVSRLDSIKITRLKLGHTKITHDYVLTIRGECPYNCDLIIKRNPVHILLDCSLYHN